MISACFLVGFLRDGNIQQVYLAAGEQNCRKQAKAVSRSQEEILKSMMNYVTYTKDTKKLHFAPSKELLMLDSRMLRSQSAYGGSMQQHAGERELPRTLGAAWSLWLTEQDHRPQPQVVPTPWKP